MKILLILFYLFLPQEEQEAKHKIELFVFNERCIPINYLIDKYSFQRSWYTMARKYKGKEVPILTDHDILEFDKVNFNLKISDTGWGLLIKEDIPSLGIPVMLVVDGEVAYGAWLWTKASSFTCDGVSLMFDPAADHILHIEQSPDEEEELRIPKPLQ